MVGGMLVMKGGTIANATVRRHAVPPRFCSSCALHVAYCKRVLEIAGCMCCMLLGVCCSLCSMQLVGCSWCMPHVAGSMLHVACCTICQPGMQVHVASARLARCLLGVARCKLCVALLRASPAVARCALLFAFRIVHAARFIVHRAQCRVSLRCAVCSMARHELALWFMFARGCCTRRSPGVDWSCEALLPVLAACCP